MEQEYDERHCGRIVGIDPGSTTLGIAVIEYHLKTLEIVKSYCWTINAGRLDLNKNDVEEHNERYARIFKLSDVLYEKFRKLLPNFIISESPFMKKRFPLAFAVLTEVVFGIRVAVRRYDKTVKLELVDPMTAKKSVGAIVKKGGDQKTPVHDALRKLLPTLFFDESRSSYPFEELDEHSVDAFAIAYHKWTLLFD